MLALLLALVSPSAVPLAEFLYAGVSRRAELRLADNRLVQSFGLDTDLGGTGSAAGVGLGGLDGLGRPREMRWVAGAGSSNAGQVLIELRYFHDVMGQRVGEVRTPEPTLYPSPGNVQESQHRYDPFQRLEKSVSRRGPPFLGGAPDSPLPPPFLAKDDWSFDHLGNWARLERERPGAAALTQARLHDYRNRIFDQWTTPAGGSPSVKAFLYDRAGNLIFDGTHAYQYDAWNRLIQVNRATRSLTDWPQEPGAEPGAHVVPNDLLILGHLVKHDTYDGLGRLVRVQTPFPEPSAEPLLRSERFFYDGVRRIQEVRIDPLVLVDEGPGGGDNDTNTLDGENEQIGEPPPPGSQLLILLNREYVYSAGDGLAGLDELLVQYGPDRTAWWVIQDAGGDCIGLARAISGQPTQLVWQASYDAYGTPISVVDHAPHERLHAGHKGLFVERLDAAAVQLPTFQDTPRLWPGAVLSGHARNRTLLTHLGRWGQTDPNATGMGVIAKAAFFGQSFTTTPGIFDLKSHQTDGPNIYAYLGSSTCRRSDPMGLLFGFDDAVLIGFSGLKGAVGSMIDQYAANLESDADWATDWSQGDDWHSRLESSWVARSFSAGLVAGLEEGLEDATMVPSIEDLVAPLGGSSASASIGGKIARAAARGSKAFRKYNMIRGSLPGFDKTWTKHGLEQAERLTRAAFNSKGKVPQSWFTNRVQTERFLSRLDMAKGSRTIDLPPGMGRVAMPDGRIISATKLRIVTTATGGGKPRLDHAYPMP